MEIHKMTEAQMKEFIEIATGMKFDDILSDKEKYVTFTEVSMREQAANHQFRATGDMKYAKIAAKCRGLLRAMRDKAQDKGEYLHLKPSELSNLLTV